MIDTLKLHSPPLDRKTADTVHRQLDQHMKRKNETGEVYQDDVWADLQGPWDVPLRVSLLPAFDAPAPFLIVEASVHKLLIGHNVLGGPIALQPAGRWLANLTAEMLGVPLRGGDEWLVERADLAEAYRLPPRSIEDIFIGMHHAQFPNREASRFGERGIKFSGDSTAVTLYHKGPEFSKKDMRRLVQVAPEDVAALRARAWETLRVEVQVKNSKLRYDFRNEPYLGKVTAEYLQNLYDHEVAKLSFDGIGTQPTVRTEQAVDARLREVYGKNKGRRLVTVWRSLATLGEKVVRREMLAQTFSRNREALLYAGCSWLVTDACGQPVTIPPDFRLVGESPYRSTEIDKRIQPQLLPFTGLNVAPHFQTGYADPPRVARTFLPRCSGINLRAGQLA